MARDADGARRPGVLGMGLALAGGVLVLVSILGLTWYSSATADSVGRITFGRLATAADGPGLPAIVPAYFDWLAWVLLIGVVAVGAFANLPSAAAPALRVLGGLLGFGGAAATYWALEEFKSFGDEGTYALHHASAGVWLTLIGFVLAGIGAALGPV